MISGHSNEDELAREKSEAEFNRVASLLQRYRLVYVASPFTKYEGGMRVAAFFAARVAGRLIQRGVSVFAPIPHSFMIAEFGGLDPTDHTLWLGQCEPLMQACDALAIVQMDGWQESFGVKYEIATFQNANKPLHFLPWDLSLTEGDWPEGSVQTKGGVGA